jgi:hypothetical protein
MAVFDTGSALTTVPALRTVVPLPMPDCELDKTKR